MEPNQTIDLNTQGIKHLRYEPNLWINHLLKDDCLYISYDREIELVVCDGVIREYMTGYDKVIRGWDMIEVLKRLESEGYNIEEIKQQLEVKRLHFQKTHPLEFERTGQWEPFFPIGNQFAVNTTLNLQRIEVRQKNRHLVYPCLAA